MKIFTFKITYISEYRCCKSKFMVPSHFSAILINSAHPDIKKWSCEGESEQEVKDIAIAFSKRFGVTLDQILFM